jgi:predicted RNA-binding Zn ribbon-like protein
LDGGNFVDDLALSLASTIRHDGNGGVADNLSDLDGLRRWVTDNPKLLAEHSINVRPGALDHKALEQIRELRRAIRALFARAVRPEPPSRADASRLMPMPQALDTVNTAAARQPLVPRLTWANDPAIVLESAPVKASDRLAAGIARATIQLLSGPHGGDLHACQAPRCVLYFVKDHPRQQWCKPSCGTRARVARHYRRHHEPAGP